MSNKYFPLYAFLLFAAIGVAFWLSLNAVFYLFNFVYIGSFLSLGAFLTQRRSRYARNIVQIGVGLYMFGFLGLVMGENMQIEGFWYFLFLGVFQAAVIHYAVAKIAGPFLFGRMASITLKNIRKLYPGSSLTAVSDFNMKIDEYNTNIFLP